MRRPAFELNHRGPHSFTIGVDDDDAEFQHADVSSTAVFKLALTRGQRGCLVWTTPRARPPHRGDIGVGSQPTWIVLC